MRGVRVSSNGTSTKGLAELKHHVLNDQKEVREVRDGGGGGGQGLSNEDESRINNDVGANGGRKELPLVVSQRPLLKPQGPPGSVVSWERFLPFGTLKVLLVEFDDSTRHVVSALLRNCSYEVTAVANGIEAWRILADLTNHIDLVLTEVAMPYLSGVGLLNKIMNHKTCKNIPVIMMSSNDSMGIVFKCLSKGAVDFLVKPIRKNELKNLWQHVWRKCHSSSGSGSESGIRTQKSSKSRSVEGIGNNNVSNDEDDIASISPNDRNGSDNGSGTQSSWTKRAVEVDSPRPMSPWDELADTPDSTCAQDLQVKNNWAPKTVTKKLLGNDELGDIAMGHDLEIGAPRNSELHREDQSKEFQFSVSESQERKNLESEIDNDRAILEKDRIQLNGDTSNDKSREEVADLIGGMNCATPQLDGVTAELPGDILNSKIKDEGMYDPKEVPSLVLSLKRQRDVGEIEDTIREQNVLRRSNLSAFSRYNTISTANQTLTGNVGSCSPHDNSSEADKTENLQTNSKGNLNQRSNGSSNNNDMGSTTNNTFANLDSSDKLVPKSGVNTHLTTSAFQPVRNGHTASLQVVTPNKNDATTVSTVLAKANDISSQVQVQHHHHHYHHHHHHVHNTKEQKKAAKADDLSLRTIVGSPTVLTTPVEGNAANYSLNGSASGSYNGSNGQNGSSNAVVTEGAIIGSENGLAANCGAGAGGGSGSGSGVDQSRHAHREAALNKFRQKRKERCFDKKMGLELFSVACRKNYFPNEKGLNFKGALLELETDKYMVRYQSRKKLAEQRPRVRGQFVRQGVCDNKSKDADC